MTTAPAPYYADEHVELYLGDCLDLVDVWAGADVLVTDPPYGVAYAKDGLHSRRRLREAAAPSIAGDDSPALRDAVLDAWGDRPAVVFGSWRIARPPRVTHRLIWHKANRRPGVAPGAWFPTDEEIYLLGRGWVGRPTGTVITTTEHREFEPKRWGHPTPKPVELMSRLIEKCPAGTTADPFTGSGATLVATRNLGRRAIGVEVDESYCETTARRLQQQAFVFAGLDA